MREKPVRCFSSAAEQLRGPEGFLTSPAFADLRWTMAGDQRREEMRLFCRKLLKRLDGMGMPFYPAVGAMDHRTARYRYVTGLDPWAPLDSPFLDGTAIRFRHCVHAELDPRSWYLFAEIAFDVARLAHTPVMWGGFCFAAPDPGTFMLYDGPPVPAGWHVDNRTYGVKGVPRYEPRFDGE